MRRLWDGNGVDAKRAGGLLIEDIVNVVPATNPRYRGGRSMYVKLGTVSRQHIGTLHEIVMPDGSVAHSHPKDYTRRDCTRVRVPDEPGPRSEPQPQLMP